MRKLSLFILIFFFTTLSLFSNPKIALVLSGGGARGIAHIPIIAELERRGIYPDYVVGTSMGALIGSLYAAGYSANEIEKYVEENNLVEAVFNLDISQKEFSKPYTPYAKIVASLTFSKSGIGEKNSIMSDVKISQLINSALCKVINVTSFDELPIPFRAIGTNLTTGEMIVFESDLYSALRSSMSLPFIFSPEILKDGRCVVDGGMSNNLPASVARELGADIVIAVDVNDSVKRNGLDSKYLDTFSGTAIQTIILISHANANEERSNTDYLFTPSLSKINVVDFFSVEEILDIGRACVDENKELFDEIDNLIEAKQERRESYKEREYFSISKIYYPEILNKYSKKLKAFENRVYDEYFVFEFSTLLQDYKRMLNLKDISYYVEGNSIVVSCKEIQRGAVRVSAGFEGQAALSLSKISNLSLFFEPKATLSFSTFLKEHTLSALINVGSQNMIKLSYSHPLYDKLSSTMSISYALGSFSKASDIKYAKRNASYELYSMASFSVDYKNYLQFISLSLEYSYYGLKYIDNIYLKHIHGPSISLDYTFKLKNLNLSLQLALSYYQALGYRIISDLALDYEYFSSSLTLRSIRENDLLNSSYYLDNLSYPSRDYIYSDLCGRYKLFSLGLYLKLFEQYDYINKPIGFTPFAAIDKFEYGVCFISGITLLPDYKLKLLLYISNTFDFSLGICLK